MLLPALPSLQDSSLEMLRSSAQHHPLVSRAHRHQGYCNMQGYYLRSCRNRSRDDEIESELAKSVDFLAGAYSRWGCEETPRQPHRLGFVAANMSRQ